MTENSNIGHNNPPSDETILLEMLQGKYENLDEMRQNVLASFDKVPEKIESDEIEAKVIKFIKTINTYIREAEKSRKEEKQPYLDLGKVVQDFFVRYKDDFEAVKKDLTKILTPYQKQKADDERARAELLAEEARKKAEQEAANAQTEGDLNAALKAEKKAESYEKRVEKSGHIGRTEDGVSASIRGRIVCTDLDMGLIDLEALRFYLKPEAVKQAINAYIKDGKTELKGAIIEEQFQSVVR